MLPTPTPCGLPFYNIGVRNPKTSIAIVSGTGKATNFSLTGTFIGSISTKAHSKFWRKGSVGVSRPSRDCPDFLSTPYPRKG